MNNPKMLLDEANSMSKMVVSCFQKKKFDNKFLLSLVTMSVEKYCVSYLLQKNEIPVGHTLGFLAGRLAKYEVVSQSSIVALEELDEKIGLCSLNAAPEYSPNDEEMEKILAGLEEIRNIANKP